MEAQIDHSDYAWNEERFIAFIWNWRFKSSPSTNKKEEI
jgi:hypothetical protein